MGRDRGRPDYYSRRAKAEGKPARSVFKLEEIDKRWKILRRGDRVLDLGCAPGSWLQYAAKKVGPGGRALGIDLQPITISLPPHAEAVVGDAFELQTDDLESFQVILSDMAPQTMGDHWTDAARSAALVEHVLLVATARLEPTGHLVAKLLEGEDLPVLRTKMREMFEKVELFRPKATRKESTEIFLIGLSKKA